MQRTTPESAEVELGVFPLTDMLPGDTGPRRVRDTVDVGVFEDQAGLDVFGVGAHRTSRFTVSSPAVVLATVAARISSITLTPAVSVLSVLDLVCRYQGFAQGDFISGGRAEITARRCAYAATFEIFGVGMGRYEEVSAAKVDLLRMIAIGGGITCGGAVPSSAARCRLRSPPCMRAAGAESRWRVAGSARLPAVWGCR
ncbi:LLM class flavin-dependent oxidoreductase [Streptomyces sp. NPDC005803]|uniref:LLM class flavin-dependent oxidoreductase n=1 Tax=Streptomyces sp. NPDC005803 TaxID=3154297 RepID=UPI0033C91071